MRVEGLLRGRHAFWHDTERKDAGLSWADFLHCHDLSGVNGTNDFIRPLAILAVQQAMRDDIPDTAGIVRI